MSLRDELLALTPGNLLPVPLPGGKTVYVPAMSIEDSAEYSTTLGACKEFGVVTAIVVFGTRNADGRRIFTDEDAPKVAAMAGPIGAAILKAWNQQNGGVEEGN